MECCCSWSTFRQSGACSLEEATPSQQERFPPLRDDAYWFKNKKKICTILSALGLENVIGRGPKPTNREVHLAQCRWFFDVLEDTMIAASAKTIVTKHKDTMNSVACFRELNEFYKKSMATQHRTTTLSNYLTSVRLKTIEWRNTHESFVLHWKEQLRQYNELSDEPYTDDQGTRFLNQAVSGVPHLDQVFNMNNQARKAAGITTKIRFDEFVELLIDQAQVYDQAQKRKKNPSVERQVNLHETFIFDDTEDSPSYELEAFVHDMDTPAELILNQAERGPTRLPTTSSGPRKVMMNAETWRSLEKKDQVSWDQISEKGKSTILNYAKQRSSNSNSDGL